MISAATATRMSFSFILATNPSKFIIAPNASGYCTKEPKNLESPAKLSVEPIVNSIPKLLALPFKTSIV